MAPVSFVFRLCMFSYNEGSSILRVMMEFGFLLRVRQSKNKVNLVVNLQKEPCRPFWG